MVVGWVHRPSPAPHRHGASARHTFGCQLPKSADGLNVGDPWVCPECETLWILCDYMRWWHWERANWWQRWKYWNWTHGRETV